MALEDILKKIEQRNRKESAQVKKEASKKCNALKKEAAGEVKRIEERGEIEAKQKAADLKKRLIQEARLSISKEILKTKSDIVDEVFEQALKKLENLPKKDFFLWLGKTIKKVHEPGKSQILVRMKDVSRKDVKEFLEKSKDIKNIGLSKESSGIESGFVLKRPRKETNCTFASLLGEESNKLRIKTGKILFKDASP